MPGRTWRCAPSRPCAVGVPPHRGRRRSPTEKPPADHRSANALAVRSPAPAVFGGAPLSPLRRVVAAVAARLAPDPATWCAGRDSAPTAHWAVVRVAYRWGPGDGTQRPPHSPPMGGCGPVGRRGAHVAHRAQRCARGDDRLRAGRGIAACGRRIPHHWQLRPQGPGVALRPFGKGGTPPLMARDPSGRRPAPQAPLPTFRGRC